MRRGAARRRSLAQFAAAALVAVAPVPAEASEVAFPPFAWAEVDFEPDCAPNAAFNRVLTLLFGPGSFPDNAAAFDEPLHDAVAGDAHHVLRVDRAVAWHGLHLVEIRAHFGVERGPANLSLVFADGPDRVREVWSLRGWDLPPAGEKRMIDGAAIRSAIGIERDGALSAVTCFGD